MNRFGWLALLCALAGMALGGCGDDDGGTDVPDVDMGTPVTCAEDPCEATEQCFDRVDSEGTVTGHRCVGCPDVAPNPDELMMPCCFRASNAERLDGPEFRVTNLQISEPEGTALTSSAVLNILAEAVEDERFNWLMRATVDGTNVTVETGYGEWDGATSTYNFVDGVAPAPGDVNRWNPITIEGTLEGDTFSAPPVPGSFTVPIFDESGENLDLELPLNSFEVVSATFSEERTCIGTRINDGAGYRNYETAGDVRTYITVADAEISIVTQLAGQSLCNLISGSDCAEDATGDWRNTPNAICDTDGNCTAACDYAATMDCNAWEIRGQFAAAGVEIAD